MVVQGEAIRENAVALDAQMAVYTNKLVLPFAVLGWTEASVQPLTLQSVP
jgi:hypothetical protein